MKSILINDTTSCDYILDSCPSEEQVVDIEATVNEVILSGLSVSIEFMDREQAAAIVDLSNKERLFVCKDGHPVSSAFVYRTVVRHPDTFVVAEGCIMLMI